MYARFLIPKTIKVDLYTIDLSKKISENILLKMYLLLGILLKTIPPPTLIRC
jgi:hypothetical protein